MKPFNGPEVPEVAYCSAGNERVCGSRSASMRWNSTGEQLLAGPLDGLDEPQLVRALVLLRRLRVIALGAPA